MSKQLVVRVNDELLLDAGRCDVAATGLIVRPPETTLFRQVLMYLQAKRDPPRCSSDSRTGREGVAAAAVTLRWGSYLAVLLDRSKPAWTGVDLEKTSRISNDEMARINIEASAALAEWVDLYRAGGDLRLYEQLVDRAVHYLPMPAKRSRPGRLPVFAALAHPETAARLIEAAGPMWVNRVRSNAECHPSRVYANAVINTAWRNGPVEDIHAGAFGGYPLDRSRLTVAEEATLMRFASEGLSLGMRVCRQLGMEQPGRSWADQVLPYALGKMMLITPSGWTLDEESRDIHLPEGSC